MVRLHPARQVGREIEPEVEHHVPTELALDLTQHGGRVKWCHARQDRGSDGGGRSGQYAEHGVVRQILEHRGRLRRMSGEQMARERLV